MDITFRRDPTNYRPRINKHNSVKDSEQKKAGNYFLADVSKMDAEEDDEEDAKYDGGAGGGGKKGGNKKAPKEKKEGKPKAKKDEDN